MLPNMLPVRLKARPWKEFRCLLHGHGLIEMNRLDSILAVQFCNELKDRLFLPSSDDQCQISRPSNNHLMLSGLCDPGDSFYPIRLSVRMHSGKWCIIAPEVQVQDVYWLSPFCAEQDQDLRNWHRDEAGRLCWIYPQEWAKSCTPMRDTNDAVRAALQMTKDVKVLLGYHIEAYRHRYLCWQKCWDFHPHGY